MTRQKTKAYAKHIFIFANAQHKTLNISIAKKKKSLSFQPHSYIEAKKFICQSVQNHRDRASANTG